MAETGTSSIPLNIALVGAGRIGSTFAYKLARAGHTLTVVARPVSPRFRQLERDGGVILDTGEHAKMGVAEALNEEVAYDLVIVTTLAHQIGPLIPVLARSRAKQIHFMFVEFGPEQLAAAVGEHRCSFGMPFVMAMLDGEGRLKPTISQRRKTLHGDRRWVDLFDQAGVPSALEPQMTLWLRCHTPMTIAFESISVLALRRGQGASWAEATTVAKGLRGGLRIVKRLEGRLHPRSKATVLSSPTPVVATLLWLISRVPPFRELLATGLKEAQALTDQVAAAGLKAEPPDTAAIAALRAMRPTEDAVA